MPKHNTEISDIELDLDTIEETIPINLGETPSKKENKTKVIKEEKSELINCLRNEKVIVRFINRKYELTDNPKHVYAGGMANSAVRIFTLPLSVATKSLVNPLTVDEQKYLEHILGLEENDLSIYKRNDNFWENIAVPLRKEDNMLDLSDPMSYIHYKILLCNGDQIAPNLDALATSPKATYQFVLVTASEVQDKEESEMNNTTKAYRLFGQIENNENKMRYVLSIMEGKAISDNVDMKWLSTQVHAQLKKDPQLFIDILGDKYLDVKLFNF